MDNFEQLVHLYLRLNGFFTVTNFLVHNPAERTDVDVYGVRFPHKREIVAGECLKDDPDLELSNSKIDVILAEVKRSDVDFNSTWRDPSRMRYFVDFLGFFSCHDDRQRVSETLARLEPFDNDQIRIRPIIFTGATGVKIDPNHRRLEDVLAFVERRLRENEQYKRYRPMWEGTFAGEVCRLIKGTRMSLTLDQVEAI